MRDLREFHDPHLYLPISGKTYKVESPDAASGLRLRRMLSDPDIRWTDEEEVNELATLLGATVDVDEDGDPRWKGGAWGQMLDDGISWPEIIHAGRTALVYFGQSSALGEIYWETAMTGSASGNKIPPMPEAAASGGNRQERRAAAKKTPAKKAPARKAPAKKTPAAKK